jgi:tetratricopeptide (TPR) repeat protein
MQYIFQSKYYLYVLVTICCLILSACGSAPSQSSNADEVQNQNTLEAEYSGIIAALPERPMSPVTLEILLEAEFSGYRGDTAKVVELYLRAARETQDPQLLARTVQIAIEMGDLDRAMQAAVIWHETEPDNKEARTVATQMLARNGESEAAWLIAKDSNNPRLLRLVATETAASGNIPQILWLGQEIESFGVDKEAHSELYTAQAILLNQLEREPQAAELARHALILDPTNISAVLVRIEALIKLELDQEAATSLESWLLGNWNRVQDRASLLTLFMEMDTSAADASLSRLFELHPDSVEILMPIAELKLNTRQLVAAEMLYLQAAELPDHQDLAHLQLGRIQHLDEDIDSAFNWYSLVPLGPYYQYAQDQIVNLLGGAGRTDELETFFADQRSNNLDAREQLLVMQSRYLNSLIDDTALFKFLNKALDQFPDNIDLRYSRSLAAERINRLDVSEKDLRAVIALDENNANALNALGYLLTNRTDRHAEAYELIEKALSLDPESPAIQDSMGWVLFKLGQFKDSLPYLSDAQGTLFDPEVISHHAEVLWRLDRVDEALDLIGIAMLQFPGNDLLNEIRRRILDDLNNF